MESEPPLQPRVLFERRAAGQLVLPAARAVVEPDRPGHLSERIPHHLLIRRGAFQAVPELRRTRRRIERGPDLLRHSPAHAGLFRPAMYSAICSSAVIRRDLIVPDPL